MIYWNGEDVEVLGENNRPFIVKVNHFDAFLYEDNIGAVKMFGVNKHGGLEGFTFLKD